MLLQNTDSSAVLQTAEKAGKYAFGWDSDMSAYSPKAHLASAIANWGPYYIKADQGRDGRHLEKRAHRLGRQGRPERPGVQIADVVPEDVKTQGRDDEGRP